MLFSPELIQKDAFETGSSTISVADVQGIIESIDQAIQTCNVPCKREKDEQNLGTAVLL